MNLPELSKREKILLLVLLAAALAYVAYTFVFNDQFNKYRQTINSLMTLKSDMERLRIEAESLPTETKALEAARKHFAAASAKFSTQMQDGLFLLQFGETAQKNNIEIRKFKPLDVVDKGYLLILPVEIEMYGLYPDVTVMLDFFDRAANLTQTGYLRFESKNRTEVVSSREGDTTVHVVNDGMVSATMTLFFYSLPSPQGRLQLEQIEKWLVGRPNPFLPSE